MFIVLHNFYSFLIYLACLSILFFVFFLKHFFHSLCMTFVFTFFLILEKAFFNFNNHKEKVEEKFFNLIFSLSFQSYSKISIIKKYIRKPTFGKLHENFLKLCFMLSFMVTHKKKQLKYQLIRCTLN